MSLTSAPFGFRPIFHPSGLIRAQAFPDGIASAYGSALYMGMPVILNTNGTITQGTAAADILGVFAGVSYIPSGGGRPIYQPNWVASTAYDAGTMMAYVYTDPDIVYDVQADGSIAATAVGDQADVSNVTNGSSYTGMSQATLSATLKGAGVQGQFRIIGLQLTPDNAWGDTYTKVQVQVARHQYISNKTAI